MGMGANDYSSGGDVTSTQSIRESIYETIFENGGDRNSPAGKVIEAKKWTDGE